MGFYINMGYFTLLLIIQIILLIFFGIKKNNKNWIYLLSVSTFSIINLVILMCASITLFDSDEFLANLVITIFSLINYIIILIIGIIIKAVLNYKENMNI